MPIPAQFQLGLELTNIVHPLSRALWTAGSLAMSNAIENVGSNVITEAKLASLIGRLTIGTQFYNPSSEWLKQGRELFSRERSRILEQSKTFP